METFNLQRIFDKRKDWYDKWFEQYKKTVNKFVDVVKNNDKWTDDDLYNLICAQDNHIANSGQWGTIYNTDNNPEFNKIKVKWESDLKPIINEIVKNGDITPSQFKEFRKIFTSCCNKTKNMAANRVLAAFLPSVLTTTIHEKDFYYVEDELKKRLKDYTPPKERLWSESNKYFTKYCNQNVKFNDTWQSSIFNWILRDYFKQEDEKNIKRMKDMNAYKLLLQANHNLILTGAPGTGKTYLAKQIAQQMIFGEIKNSMTDEEKQRFNEQCGFVQFHPSYDYTDFVEGLRPFNNDDGQIGFKRKDGVFKNFCERALKSLNGSQQITNFDDVYNLFVDDILEGNSIVLETPKQKRQFKLEVNKNRNFYAIPQTDKATPLPITKELIQVYMESGEAIDWKSYVPAIGDYIKSKYQLLLKKNTYNKDAKYIFIIDEINRGEISKIFGELFFAIDPGYRGSEKCSDLRTQYANLQESSNEFDRSLNISESNNYGHFFVPENVYIIGTMNDIDRSVESMDFAFRRRFAFKEIKADENVGMLDGLQEKEDAIKRMKRLNDEISKIEGLSSAYHIGASYFLKLESYDGDFDKLWEYHLEGLLREYLRGMPDIEGNIKKLKDAYNDTTADNGQLPVQSDAE